MKKLLFVCTLLYTAVQAQQPVTITEKEKQALIDSVATKLQQYYVFPDKAAKMAQFLKKQNSEKAYKAIADYKTFLDLLAKDLQQVHQDRHMSLFYNPARVAEIRQWRSQPQPTPAMLERRRREESRVNYGFVKTEILPGNIGYVDFREFFPVTEDSKNAVAAAMGFIARADAVIVDLRKNGGGDPAMVQYVLSYFMDSVPVHYNSLYDRITNKTTDYYSLAQVKGTKMPQTDLYVLTSGYTFSGAEEFAYNLKNLKRATIIGETTGGGAHPTDLYIINDQVAMAIPFARAISPFTKGNWEGTGVAPDVNTNAEKALLKAQQLALEKRAAGTIDPLEKAQAAWLLAAVEAQFNPVTIHQDVKASYAGTYGERTITVEGTDLYYQRGSQPKRRLVPLADDLFAVEGMEYFRVQFVRNGQGTAEKLRGLYDNGKQDESVRTTKAF